MTPPKQHLSPFQQKLLTLILWVRANREQAITIVGVVVIVGIIGAFWIQRRQTLEAEAWTQLNQSQGLVEQGKLAEAQKELADWENRYRRSSAASYAKFLKGTLLTRSTDYAQAAQVYGELAQQASPVILRPLALAAQVESEEKAGRIKEAMEIAKSFVEQYPDHFLTSSMLLTQARLTETSGQPAAAAAVYDRYVLLFPQSPWTAFATFRKQILGGNAPTIAAPGLPSPTLPSPAQPPAH